MNLYSKFINFITGGLNYQIEHHLFPSVNVQYYPLISKIVRKHLDKNNIKYNETNDGITCGFVSSIEKSIKRLKELGTTT